MGMIFKDIKKEKIKYMKLLSKEIPFTKWAVFHQSVNGYDFIRNDNVIPKWLIFNSFTDEEIIKIKTKNYMGISIVKREI